ncbi:cellulose biosynthesis protein BcsN [Rhizobium tubonense]|uniref:cellulose biosynthesis protein BcsN n=1 Tax=Rhizobium tubonense TaxID=484088 RepID=UPI0018A81ECF|nr:cellulose biosynthesis protein BcsN [Rhizobium tubonense]
MIFAFATVSGCASKDGIRVPGPAATVSNDKAFALPPPGGPSIVNVVQHDFNNAARQDIFLFTSAVTPGQNVLRVTFFGPVGRDYDDRKGLGYASIRNGNVDLDMRRDLPGVPMARSDYYVQNNYGPFGYATGRSRSGDTCLYGWQQIRSSDNDRTTFTNRGTVDVRLRLCDAHASEQALLRVMYGYTIAGTFPAPGWNPYDGPPTTDPSLGRTGNPIYPGVPANHANPPPPAFQVRDRVPPVVVRRQASAPAPIVTPAPAIRPTGPLVPLPTVPEQGAKTSAVTVPGPPCANAPEGGVGCK